MSSVPFWVPPSDELGSVASWSTGTGPVRARLAETEASQASSWQQQQQPLGSQSTVHQIIQAKLQQFYSNPDTPAHHLAGLSSPAGCGWPAGTNSAFAAASPAPAWPPAPWDTPAQSGVPDSLEAAYGNYLDQNGGYSADGEACADYSSGLPTPELATDGYQSGATFHDPFDHIWSPQSLASPSNQIHALPDSHMEVSTLNQIEHEFETYAGAKLGAEAGAGAGAGPIAINPTLCSPQVQPARLQLSLAHFDQAANTQAELSLYQTYPSLYMPSPISRRASLAPSSAPISLAPLPPLPPLPNDTASRPKSPSTRMAQLTTLALARRAARGILPATRSSTSSRSGSQYAHSPSAAEEDDSDQSDDDNLPKGTARTRTGRSTVRRALHGSRPRPAPGGVAGFAACCTECGAQVATLHFRGKADALAVAVKGEYICAGCSPIGESLSGEGHRRQPSGVEEEVCAGYEATLSAVLDTLQNDGCHSPPQQPAHPPRERLPSIALGLSGMNKSVAAGSDVLCCDVCKYALARGELVPVDSRQAIGFGVEAVCPSCKDKFQRCSDCGGGGGPRLGVGKWRSVALFPGGRKTCQLSHLRLGSLDEMSYDIHQVNELPAHELANLLELCSEIHYTSIVTSLATPDALEGGSPAARTFDEVHRMGVDGWSLYEHLLQEDVEVTEGKRRYVGLRWSTPVPRKKAKTPKSSAARPCASSPVKAPDSPLPAGTILRPGKKLVGVVIGELDLAEGSLFLPLTMPSGHVGEQYDGQTALYVALHHRIDRDLAALNATRSIRAQLPALREAWTLAMVRQDARGKNYLEKRRGYAPLEAYAARQAARAGEVAARLVSAAEQFLPAELLPGWAIFVREVGEGDEWAARTTGVAAAAGMGAQAVASHKRKASVGSEAGMVAKKGKKRG